MMGEERRLCTAGVRVFVPESLDFSLQAFFESLYWHPHFDLPDRVRRILTAIEKENEGVFLVAEERARGTEETWKEVSGVHNEDYVAFLRYVVGEEPFAVETFATRGAFSKRTLQRVRQRFADIGRGHVSPTPNDINFAGLFVFDTWTAFSTGATQAALDTVQAALNAADFVASGLLEGAPTSPLPISYSICRTPGHHAEAGVAGGYCYFNNAVLAAQHLLHRGLHHVTVVDFDYHCGNGILSLVRDGSSALSFASIHADPMMGFEVYFAGTEEDSSERVLMLPFDPLIVHQPEVLHSLLGRLIAFVEGQQPDALVVCLGVDGLLDDPVGPGGWEASESCVIGRRLRDLHLATVVVQEGGYSDRTDECVMNFFHGYLGLEEPSPLSPVSLPPASVLQAAALGTAPSS